MRTNNQFLYFSVSIYLSNEHLLPLYDRLSFNIFSSINSLCQYRSPISDICLISNKFYDSTSNWIKFLTIVHTCSTCLCSVLSPLFVKVILNLSIILFIQKFRLLNKDARSDGYGFRWTFHN
jgi:hypothetical protein